MRVKSIKQLKSLRGRRVLLRADFNVPITKSGKVGKSEDYRIVKTVPTIQYLISRGAKVIILAHLGRPDGKVKKNLRLDPVAARLSHLLGKKVIKTDKILGKEVEDKITAMKNGEVMMLENIRFDKREETGDKKFAAALAALGDIFVNDGFAVSHRDQASVSIIQNYLPSFAGLLLENEVENLSRVLKNPKKPLIVIIGGAKISTKIKVIKNLLPNASKILLGGALANTVLNEMGVSVGRSIIEPAMGKEIRKIRLTDNKLVVPVDGVLAKNFQAKKGRIDAIGDVGKDEVILDIGRDTVKLYESIVKSAKMIVWNGPMGLIETPAFARGTRSLIKNLSRIRAETVVGGGETVQMIRKMGLENKFNFISTGGGAMLEFLEGRKLPGLRKIVK